MYTQFNNTTTYSPFAYNHNNNTNNNSVYTYTNTNNNMKNNYNMDDMPSIGSSPTISTPYLDSSSTIDTPYNATSPFFEAGSDFSPYLMYQSFASNNNNDISMNNGGVRNMNDNKDDVCIARYLEGGHETNDLSTKSTHDPLKFNGDPSLLLIDKTKLANKNPAHSNNTARKPSPTIKLETVTEEDSDSLFPPLNSSQQSATTAYSPVMKNDDMNEMSLDDILGLGSGSPLSESIDESDNDSLYEEEAQQTKKQTQQTQRQPVKEEASSSTTENRQGTTSRKRKASPSASTTTIAAAPKKRRSSVAKKSSAGSEEKLYQCPLCDHTSKRRYNLSTHIKTHDKNRVKEFDCPACNKAFDRRHDRDRHLATVHRGERSFTCDHCTTHFSRRDALNRHLVQKHDYDEEDFE